MLLSSFTNEETETLRGAHFHTTFKPKQSGSRDLALNYCRLSLCLPWSPPRPLHSLILSAPFPLKTYTTFQPCLHNLGEWQQHPSSTLKSHPLFLPLPHLPHLNHQHVMPVLAPYPSTSPPFTGLFTSPYFLAWCTLMVFYMVSQLPL